MSGCKGTGLLMYLIDTNVVSELRKKEKANPGVSQFFQQTADQGARLFLSVITVGELRRGVERIRQRGDRAQAEALEGWLHAVISDYAECILDFTESEAQVWGRLRVPHPENALDKQIAATALSYGLSLVTRNSRDFVGTGVSLVNPFQ